MQSRYLTTVVAAALLALPIVAARAQDAAAPDESNASPSAMSPSRAAAEPSAANESATAAQADAEAIDPQDPTTTTDPAAPLEQVTISGEQPGPGLWKVTRDSHVLWIVSTISPSPKDMKWRSSQVEAAVSDAQVVLAGLGVKPNIGFFRGLRYLPALLRTRFNPDKAVLKDIITPEQHARWLELRKQYLKDDDDYERIRPMFLAFILYSRAIEKAGLTERPLAGALVMKAANKRKIKAKPSEITVDVKNVKQLIKDFNATPRQNELECFLGVMDNLDAELELMKQRAAAWGVGDIEAFKQIPRPAAFDTCVKAVTSAPGLQPLFASLTERMTAKWIADVETAFWNNDVTVVLMDLDNVLKEADGAIALLTSRGYTVEGPQ